MPVSKRRKTRRRGRRNGGGSLPAPYFNAPLQQPAAAAGHDLLAPSSTILRPKIGGFIPTVGEPFVAAASKYIAPLALIAGYKFMQKSGPSKKTRRRR
jgi:hypothetical protein